MSPTLPSGWLDWSDPPEPEYDIRQRRSEQAAAQPRCHCGRFAKPLGTRGNQFGDVWEIVLCSVHGLGEDRRF